MALVSWSVRCGNWELDVQFSFHFVTWAYHKTACTGCRKRWKTECLHDAVASPWEHILLLQQLVFAVGKKKKQMNIAFIFSQGAPNHLRRLHFFFLRPVSSHRKKPAPKRDFQASKSMVKTLGDVSGDGPVIRRQMSAEVGPRCIISGVTSHSDLSLISSVPRGVTSLFVATL